MKKIDVLMTAFRDGIQSAYGARVLSKDYMPVVEAASKAGIRRFEAGGGALFQASVLYCGENPFDRVDAFRRAAGPDAELQTLSRGASMVGIEPQSREVINLYTNLLRRHGINTVRNFDALNDNYNLAETGKIIVAAGLKHEPAICVTDPPPGSALEGIDTPEYYQSLLVKFLESDLPFNSVCFKDSVGTVRPSKVRETVRLARKLLGKDISISWHTHDTLGLGIASYLAAIEAGADRVDLSLSPLSGGACQPDIISFWHALRGSDFELDLDIQKILQTEEMLKEALRPYTMVPEAERTDPLSLFYPMPGGAVAANANLLRDQGLSARYDEIIHALGEVYSKGGGGAPVTPVSQYYVQQAYENVLYGAWKRIAPGYGRMVLGYLGTTPTDPDPIVREIASKSMSLPPATTDPLSAADADPAKNLSAFREKLTNAGIPVYDEALALVALCGEKGINLLNGRATISLAKAAPAIAPGSLQAIQSHASGAAAASSDQGDFTVILNEKVFGVRFSGDNVSVNGVSFSYAVADGLDEELLAKGAAGPIDETDEPLVETHDIRAFAPGMIIRLNKQLGDKIAIGETILVLESMSSEIHVNAKISGVVTELPIAWGDRVEAGQILMRVNVLSRGRLAMVSRATEGLAQKAHGSGVTAIESPLNGIILKIYKKPGERIHAGESILVTEAMKMEQPVNSPIEGLIESILVKQGDQVKRGQVLVQIAPEGAL